jgi:predicted nucleic acid-binding protein
MIRVLFDTNVALDALLERTPWDVEARQLWEANERGDLEAHLTANSLTDVFYVARRHANRETAWQAVEACLDQLHIISVGFAELQAAAALGHKDLEDNLQFACATAAKLDWLITRDPSGFAGVTLPVLAPSEALSKLNEFRTTDS